MGDNTHPTLTGSEIDELIRSGLSEAEIARQYGMTKAGVNYARFNEGGVPRKGVYRTTREIAKDLFPWKRVGARVSQSYEWRRLKAHSTWQVRHDENDLSFAQLTQLIEFYRRVTTQNLIAEYTPDSGLTLHGRRPEDRRLIIRPNEWTHLDASQRIHWSLPTVMPQGAEDLSAFIAE